MDAQTRRYIKYMTMELSSKATKYTPKKEKKPKRDQSLKNNGANLKNIQVGKGV